jgi:hypothetical protein
MSYLKACKSPLPAMVIKTVDTELLGLRTPNRKTPNLSKSTSLIKASPFTLLCIVFHFNSLLIIHF